jgi:hypothetical protein
LQPAEGFHSGGYDELLCKSLITALHLGLSPAQSQEARLKHEKETTYRSKIEKPEEMVNTRRKRVASDRPPALKTSVINASCSESRAQIAEVASQPAIRRAISSSPLISLLDDLATEQPRRTPAADGGRRE